MVQSRCTAPGRQSEVGKQRSGHSGSFPLPRRHEEPGVTLEGGTDSPSSSREGGAFSPAAWAPGPACLGHTLGPFSLASEPPSVKWNPSRGRVVGGASSILRAGGREEALPAPGGTVHPDAQTWEGRQSSGCPSTPPPGKLVVSELSDRLWPLLPTAAPQDLVPGLGSSASLLSH